MPKHIICQACHTGYFDGERHACAQRADMVNHPPHYKAGGIEAIDVIEAFAGTNYHRGNALKYLLRAGRKGPVAEDLRKAIWYIERELTRYAQPAAAAE